MQIRKQYTKIAVKLPREYADLLSWNFIEIGIEGVRIDDPADAQELIDKRIGWDYVDENLRPAETCDVVVTAVVPPKILRKTRAMLDNFVKSVCTTAQITLESVNSADWENEWRKYYAPIEIGRVVIVPAWMRAPAAEIAVYIDTASAFGTGQHETTSTCIELMQRFDLTGKTVLDMGCGSGILGITAAKLGAAKVILSDLDPQAVKQAQENAVRNGVSDICKAVEGDLAASSKDFDCVLANITADVLVRLAPKLDEWLSRGGIAVIGGIIDSRETEVHSAFSRFDLIEKRRKGDWIAAVYRKREPQVSAQ